MLTKPAALLLMLTVWRALSPDFAGAQNLDGLRIAPGARIRVLSTLEVSPITGEFSMASDSVLTLRTLSGARTIPSPTIDRVDRSLGRGRLAASVVVGALIGTAIGLTIGERIGGAENRRARRSEPPLCDCGPNFTGLDKLIYGGVLGLVGGTVVGVAIGHERWETVFTGNLGGERPR